MFASKLVNNGEIIFLDSGTTVQQMTIALADLISKRVLKNVRIFTNSITNFEILKELNEVTLIGGIYREAYKNFSGYLTEMVLNSLAFGKCFLGTDGISLNKEDGIMTIDVFNAKINKIIANRSKEIIILADSTKFTRKSFIRYTTLDTVDAIVTDNKLDDAIRKEFEKTGPIIHEV